MNYAKKLAVMLFIAGIVVPVLTQNAHAQRSTGEESRSFANEPFVPSFLPELQIPRTYEDIRIDGELDEAIWQHAALATNFSENFPDEKARPPIGIKVYVTYDAQNLYVAYLIEDDPSAIRSNFSDRDRIWQDDYSGMLLDTNGDGQQIYFIAAKAPFPQKGSALISQSDRFMHPLRITHNSSTAFRLVSSVEWR